MQFIIIFFRISNKQKGNIKESSASITYFFLSLVSDSKRACKSSGKFNVCFPLFVFEKINMLRTRTEAVKVNIWKIIYLNGGERYERVCDFQALILQLLKLCAYPRWSVMFSYWGNDRQTLACVAEATHRGLFTGKFLSATQASKHQLKETLTKLTSLMYNGKPTPTLLFPEGNMCGCNFFLL